MKKVNSDDTEGQKTRTDCMLLEELLAKHPDKRVYVAWDNADTHSGGKVEEVVRAAAGRLVLLYLPTYTVAQPD